MKSRIQSIFWGFGLILLVMFVAIAPAFPASAEPLSIISYNVESDDLDDTDPHLVAEDIREIVGADLWGLSEVADQAAADIFTEAVAVPGSDFKSIFGTTGSLDKLQIIYNQNKLDLLEREELDNIGGSRSPLVAHFKFLPTGQEFLFTVNHFNRGSESKRNQQAENLRDWAAAQSLPVIAVGDYNFDFDLDKKKGNKAFDLFVRKDVMTWIKPNCLKTNSCPLTGTQCDPKYASILDYVFVSQMAKKWPCESDILFVQNQVCQKEKEGFSDHYPLMANFSIP
ncbi:endonuclease/Exonuclease/phosphatase family protein [Lyngbya aestuarii BL J]|uniref:Endonuclease/Exonuclease/phosphatase family protein n=1 Tax=Lyngbya aestuarii BL J TaxID=1348334 RepID=U7QLG7_9CYAN|nr:endonuclease/exonuclease/phosphatase family protein [Lyngbya aestuarii]ERT07266.1 endonuclease/Exonuclease/phosphatase family protein [Lyngbya aestuarii BL J]